MLVMSASASVLRALPKIVRGCGETSRLFQVTTRLSSTATGDDDLKFKVLQGDQAGIAVFSMCRHAGKNAMSRKMLGELKDAMDTVRFDTNIRAVVIHSEVPGVFCAGADLKERVKMKQEEVGPFIASLRGLVNELADLPMPTIAAIEGAALGGGLEMALACDIRTASSTAKIGLVETRLAIIPGGGGTQRLARLCGPAVAKELVYTSRILTSDQAAAYGVVNHSVPQNEAGDAAYQKAIEIAEEIIPQGPIAVRMAKQAISRGSEVDLQTGLSIEQYCYAQVIPTKDRIEGLMAFKEKRKPNYKGE